MHVIYSCLDEYGSWFDYVKECEETFRNQPEHPIHIVYYEDLQEVGTGFEVIIRSYIVHVYQGTIIVFFCF